MTSRFLTAMTTAALLLFSPTALAQLTSIQDAEDLQPDVSQTSQVAQSDALESQSTDDSRYWRSEAIPDWHLEQKDLGVKFAPGQYHGNRGPASEEQGIQLELVTR